VHNHFVLLCKFEKDSKLTTENGTKKAHFLVFISKNRVEANRDLLELSFDILFFSLRNSNTNCVNHDG